MASEAIGLHQFPFQSSFQGFPFYALDLLEKVQKLDLFFEISLVLFAAEE